METALFSCWLLFLLFSPAVPRCVPTDFTLYVEKPECDFCVAINTTICTGFCYSRDSNMRNILYGSRRSQSSCTYDKVEYRTAILPGCGSNPIFTYPVALSCHCGACRTDSDECAHRAGGAGARCTKPVRHMHPYPGQSTYLIPI